MNQTITVVKDGIQQDHSGVFYFASNETNPQDRVFVLALAEDNLQVTAYITLEQVLTELKKAGLLQMVSSKEMKP